MNCVFCCVSDSYRDVTIPMITSLIKNTDSDIFVVCVGEVSLPKFDRVNRIDIDVNNLKLPNETDYPDEAMWSMGSRLMAHDVLKSMGYSRQIYIDCDTVINKNIDEMFDLVPEGNIGAVCEYNTDLLTLEQYRSQKPPEFDRRTELRGGDPYYFNSGVLVFNNTPPMFDLYKKNVIKDPTRYKFPDQDFLNEIFPDYIRLERKYNFFAELYGYKYLDIKQMTTLKKYGYTSTIIHCHCFCKPWSDIFSFPENVINAQFPIMLYYREALEHADLFESRDMVETYQKHNNAIDTMRERFIYQEAILDSM